MLLSMRFERVGGIAGISCRLEPQEGNRKFPIVCVLLLELNINIKSNVRSDSRPCGTDVLSACKQPTTVPDQDLGDPKSMRGAEGFRCYRVAWYA